MDKNLYLSEKYPTYMDKKGSQYLDRFVKVFSNLPITQRDKVVIVVNGQPISWNVAYEQLRTGGDLSKEIAEKLIKLKII